METIPSSSIGADVASVAAVNESNSTLLSSETPRARAASAVMQRRSVLIYSPQFNIIGGVETHLVRLACLLSRQHWHVTLVTTSGMLEEARVAELAAAGVEFIAPRGHKPLSIARKALWLAGTVATRLRTRHWNVVYTNAQGSLSWLLRPLKSRGTRLVHHYHTAGDQRDKGTWGFLFPLWLRAADEIVACSLSTSQNLRRVLDPSATMARDGGDKLRVVRYLSAEIAAPAERLRREPQDKLRFGFVGRLIRGKGIDMICRLSQDPELRHVEWHIHGCGQDYSPEYFHSFPNVRYHGRYQGAAELSSILARLDALTLFSTYQEGQPISLIEGMAAGLPWIATDQGGTSELMWSPANCRLIATACRYEDARAAALDLAEAIRDGRTSVVAQRRAYEDHLAPATVAERWMEFFGEEVQGVRRPALLDNAFPAVKLPQVLTIRSDGTDQVAGTTR